MKLCIKMCVIQMNHLPSINKNISNWLKHCKDRNEQQLHSMASLSTL